MSDLYYNAIGLVGPLLFTLAYAMTSLGKWHSGTLRLHLCNLFGAMALIISLSHDWNLPIFILELCWAAVAAYGIWQWIRARRNAARL